MSLFRKLLKHTNDFLTVMDEATRLEAEHYKAKGWTKEGRTWKPPDDHPEDYFDGPGSHVSLGAFIEPAAKNVGVDISEWSGTVDMVKEWLGKARKRVNDA